MFSEKLDLLKLFDWTYFVFKECFARDEELAIKQLSDSLYEVSNTDLKWMTNVIIQLAFPHYPVHIVKI
jgi:hypothetical protein